MSEATRVHGPCRDRAPRGARPSKGPAHRAATIAPALGPAVAAALAALLVASGGPPPARAQPVDGEEQRHLYLPLTLQGAALAALPLPATALPAPTAATAPAPSPTAPPPTPTAVPCPALGDRITVTSNALSAPIRANDEYFPLPIAPHPDGGSLIAWRERDAPRIRVGRLDADGALQGEPLAFDGEEVHALVAHEDGGAMAVVADDPDIYSPKYCRAPATPDKPLCAKMDVLRFDDAGGTLWRTTATDKTNVDADRAHFIWWYQHTARLLWTGERYGLYFRSATSTPRPGAPGEIDIHAGDAFRLLDGAGALVDSAWRWGCSHSWAINLAFQDGRFAAACHGDAYPNAFHVNVFEPGRHLGDAALHEGLDPTQRALGGLVPAAEGGVWLLHMARGEAAMELHLALVDEAGAVVRDGTIAEATGLPTAYPFRAHLAAYAGDRMLAGWWSGNALQLAVLDRASGALLEGPVVARSPDGVAARIDRWSEFVRYPNGDVGWAWAEGGARAVEVVRVAGCGG